MITATSSLAAGILSGTFGTLAAGTPSIASGTTSSTYSPAYILAESLGGASNADAAFLSNLEFAQDTEALLLDPHSNGALTGTPTSYVQQIINAITPGAAATIAARSAPASSAATTSGTSTAGGSSATAGSSTSSGPSTSDDSTTDGLPAGGILA